MKTRYTVFFVMTVLVSISFSPAVSASGVSDIPGDITSDGTVDISDLAQLARYWFEECGLGVANGQACTYDCQCASAHGACVGGQCVEQVDYVFLINAVSSMQSSLAAVRSGLGSFVQTADLSEADLRYSIVLYGAYPELILEFTDDPNDVLDTLDGINCSGAEAGLHADHNADPDAGLEALWIVLGGAVDKTLVNGPAVSSDYHFAFRPLARPTLMVLSKEDSDRAYFEFNRRSGQDTVEPPTLLTSAWQGEVDAVADAAVERGAFIALIINDSDMPAAAQYSDPDLQVQDPDFSNFNPTSTLQMLTAYGLQNCLQGQLLQEGLDARCYNINNIDQPGVAYNLMAATLE